MADFPALTPTSRRITQGQYAVKRFTSISGTGVTRAYSSQPFNSLIELEFSNITDAAAIQIVQCYEQSRGSYAPLVLPNELWSGVRADLRSLLERDYTWRFADQPQISSVVPGVSTISVRLEGQRDG